MPCQELYGNRGEGMLIGSFLSVVWIALLVYSFVRNFRFNFFVYPMLLLVLIYPLNVALIYFACRFGHDCI